MLAERAVKHFVGDTNIGVGERYVEHADHRVDRGNAADTGNGRLHHTRLHLLDHFVVLAQLAVRENLHRDRAVGAGLDQRLEHGRHGAGGVVEGVVLVQVRQLDDFLGLCRDRQHAHGKAKCGRQCDGFE